MDVRLGFFGSFSTVLCGSLTNDCEIKVIYNFVANYFAGEMRITPVFYTIHAVYDAASGSEGADVQPSRAFNDTSSVLGYDPKENIIRKRIISNRG